MANRVVEIYDVTLRDGTQGENVSFSIHDKLRISERLDDLGIHYIEGGWPGSNERDEGYFEEAKKLNLKKSKISAFGSARRAKKPLIKTLHFTLYGSRAHSVCPKATFLVFVYATQRL